METQVLEDHSKWFKFPFRPKRRATSIYQPLRNPEKSIRVLQLFPGSRNDELVCKLVNSTIHRAENTYQAISYTWGDQIANVTITCNHQRISITKNAAAALRALRSTTEKKLIWIDSLCINQSDSAERGHQVTVMMKIFEAAQRVYIHLGEYYEDKELALAVAYVLTLDAEKHRADFHRKVSYTPSTVDKSFLDTSDELKRAFSRLLSLEWFNRVWVQQEAAACPETFVLLGQSVIPLEQFLVLVWQYYGFARNRPGESNRIGAPTGLDPCLSIQRNRHAREVNKDEPPLLRILGECAPLKASDPRDKIYALIRLGRDRDLSDWAPKPDYAASTPTNKVYVDLAMSYLERLDFELLDYNTRRHPPSSRDIVLPSWCPDWDDNCFEYTGWLKHCIAGGSTKPEVKFSNTDFPGSTVWITTILVEDTLSFVGEQASSRGDLAKTREIEMACYEAATKRPRHFTGETSVAAYIKCIRNSYGQLSRLAPSHQEYQELRKWLHSERRELDSSIPANAESFASSLATLFYEVKFCISTRGLMCVTPWPTAPGDRVCVLKGYSYGVVLRPKGTQYQFLGRCWVHGIMHGEIVTLLEKGQVLKKSSRHSKSLSEVEEPGQDVESILEPDYSPLLEIVGEKEIEII